MSKKKRLVVNVSEKVSEAIWKMHCDQKISQSRIVERILESNLEVIGDPATVSGSERFAMVNQS
jgi:hypothetical protein